jgi:trimeric autotransporter adhesin
MSRRSRWISMAAAASMVVAGGLTNTPTARAADVAPPSIAISFDTQAIQMVNGWSTLTFTITNPNGATDLTGVGFTDTISSGIIFANPDSLTGTCGEGLITTAVSQITLAGATIPAGSSCTFKYDVLGIAGGSQDSTAGPVFSIEGGTGNTATAYLSVALAPVATAVFGDAAIDYGASTTLAFTVTNPNVTEAAPARARPAAISVFSGTLSGVGFVDTLPAGLVVATPNGLTGDCGGGSITALAGSGSITLSGATLAAGASCTFVVNVTGVGGGTKQNSTGLVASTEGGTGDPSTGSLVVGAAPATPHPIVTAPNSSTVRDGGSDGGAPAVPFFLLLAALGLAATVATVATRRSAGTRG